MKTQKTTQKKWEELQQNMCISHKKTGLVYQILKVESEKIELLQPNGRIYGQGSRHGTYRFNLRKNGFANFEDNSNELYQIVDITLFDRQQKNYQAVIEKSIAVYNDGSEEFSICMAFLGVTSAWWLYSGYYGFDAGKEICTSLEGPRYCDHITFIKDPREFLYTYIFDDIDFKNFGNPEDLKNPCFFEGYRASAKNLLVRTNNKNKVTPYTIGSPERIAYDRGWHFAFKDFQNVPLA